MLGTMLGIMLDLFVGDLVSHAHVFNVNFCLHVPTTKHLIYLFVKHASKFYSPLPNCPTYLLLLLDIDLPSFPTLCSEYHS